MNNITLLALATLLGIQACAGTQGTRTVAEPEPELSCEFDGVLYAKDRWLCCKVTPDGERENCHHRWEPVGKAFKGGDSAPEPPLYANGEKALEELEDKLKTTIVHVRRQGGTEEKPMSLFELHEEFRRLEILRKKVYGP